MSYEQKIDWMIEQLQMMMQRIAAMLARFEQLESKNETRA